jgi:hypothetical protein
MKDKTSVTLSNFRYRIFRSRTMALSQKTRFTDPRCSALGSSARKTFPHNRARDSARGTGMGPVLAQAIFKGRG